MSIESPRAALFSPFLQPATEQYMQESDKRDRAAQPEMFLRGGEQEQAFSPSALSSFAITETKSKKITDLLSCN